MTTSEKRPFQPGDTAYVTSWDTTPRQVTVERVTKTQIIVKDVYERPTRYRVSDGRQIGNASAYRQPKLEHPSPEIKRKLLEAKRQQLAHNFEELARNFARPRATGSAVSIATLRESLAKIEELDERILAMDARES